MNPATSQTRVAALLAAALGLTGPALFAQSAPVPASEEVLKLDVFTVSAKTDKGYRATNTISGTRLNQKLQDVAQNINVITEDFIKDLNVSNLSDALAYTAGLAPNSAQNEASFTVRGFDVLRPMRNGVTTSGELAVDSSNIERIEVVKGPSSVLYGVSSAGGFINYITKRPTETSSFGLRQTFASYNGLRSELDYNVGTKELGGTKLLTRFVGAYESNDGFIGTGFERKFFAPTFLWNISDKTNIFLSIERLEQRLNQVREVPTNNARTAFVEFPEGFNHNGDSVRETRATTITATLTQQLGEHWVARSSYNYHNNPQFFRTALASGNRAAAATLTQPSETLTFPSRIRNTYFPNHYGLVEAVGTYTFGGVKSTTLVGGDYLYNHLTQISVAQPSTNNAVWVLTDPTTWTVPNLFNPAGYTTVPQGYVNRYQEFKGLYITEQLQFFKERLTLTGGIRRDKYHIDQAQNSDGSATRTQTILDNSAKSPLASASFKVVPQLNVYALYSKSLVNQNGTLLNGDPVGPNRGVGKELGGKFDLLDGRLTGTVSVYQIKRTDVAQNIPGSNPVRVATTGEQTVKGWETQIFYSPSEGWQFIGSYSHNSGEVSADVAPANVGLPLVNLPENTWSLWAKHTSVSGALKGFSIGAGAIHMDDMQAFSGITTLRLAAYTKWDALLGYEWKGAGGRWNAALKINNVGDKAYRGAEGVPQPGRNYSFSIGVKF